MDFIKYQSLKQLGRKEVQGISVGDVYLFTKLDGSNAQTFLDKETNTVRACSRNRIVSLENEHMGLCYYVNTNENIQKFHKENPDLRLYGEWLVKHTISGYQDDAWDRFYVFDVTRNLGNSEVEYLPYEEYKPLLEKYGIEHVPLIAKLSNPSEQDIVSYLDKATFLLKDGEIAEGLVAKNYEYTNYKGAVIWAKYINPKFTNGSTKHKKIAQKGNAEKFIIDEYATQHLIEKEFAKIVTDVGEWHPKFINRLFHTVYYCVVTEELNDELWNIMKKFKNPSIDFNSVREMVKYKVRDVMGDKLINKG